MAAKPATKHESPKRGAAHERLGVFIGNWHAEGDSYAAGQKKDEGDCWKGRRVLSWLLASGPGYLLDHASVNRLSKSDVISIWVGNH